MNQVAIRRIELGEVSLCFRHLVRGSRKAVVLIHGNLSSSLIWDHFIERIPAEFDVVAPDLRGFGESSKVPINATRGVADFSDDILKLLNFLSYDSYVLVGHSMGGGVVIQVLIDAPSSVKIDRIVLVDPMSPYGFGGTKDEVGTPVYDDYAGSGAGLVVRYNPEFVKLLKARYRGVDHPSAPANVVRALFAEDFMIPEPVMDRLLTMLFSVEVSEDFYPGDYVESVNWPYVAPGTKGVLNAISPKYLKLRKALEVRNKPPILWVHGAKDMIVSDMSPLDIAVLGAAGYIPGYPGVEKFPPQPMLKQIQAFLEEYSEKGGTYEKRVMEGVGHTPFIEAPEEFAGILSKFLQG